MLVILAHVQKLSHFMEVLDITIITNISCNMILLTLQNELLILSIFLVLQSLIFDKLKCATNTVHSKLKLHYVKQIKKMVGGN